MADKNNPVKKFSRKEPDERRELLIRSAIHCLEKEGYAGLSVRKITKQAGVSQGMINLHFGSINHLIASAYDLMSREFNRNLFAQLEVFEGCAADKLDILFQANFSIEWMNPALLRAWLVFWSLIPASPEMADAYKRNNREMESLLRSLLTEISHDDGLPPQDFHQASQRLMSLLDGLWVRQTLEYRANASEYAVEVARQWLESFRRGQSAPEQSPQPL